MTCSWSVDQMPSVGSEIFPSNILRVMPESADLKHGEINSHWSLFIHTSYCILEKDLKMSYLSWGIPSVPEGISEVLSWASGRINYLNGQARISLSLGGFIWPVCLCNLLPHHNIEPRTGLVAKHKTGIIVIPLCVDEESPTKVHCIELMVSWWSDEQN